MSGVAGAERVKSRADFAQFLKTYEQLLKQFPGVVGFKPSGSYNSNLEKQDFGDIDLIVHIKSDKDKATVKKELQAFFTRQPDTVIVPFSSEKHAGKRTYNAGELVSVRYHDDSLGYSAQIDNIIALDPSEASFKQEFLDMPAEKQGLVLGLVKIATIETDPQILFKSLGITAPPLTQKNQEYEFNLSSVEIQLRKITYKPGTYEQVAREVIWTSRNFDDLKKILYQYDLSADFDTLLAQAKATIKNPRSNNRMQGVFASMITVKSGEVGTAKGAGKEQALAKIQQTFRESRMSIFRALMEAGGKKVVFAFGRFQPPTIGHELLINKVKQLAGQAGADHVIYVSKTQDAKTNPLDVGTKVAYLQKMFPGTNFVAADATVRTPIEAVKHLNQTYTELIWVAGSDRVPTFEKLLNDYNGKEYQYRSLEVVSSGERDPDSEGTEGMSGTKMREAAEAGNFEAFRQGLPSSLGEEDAMNLMNLIRNGLAKPAKAKKGVAEGSEKHECPECDGSGYVQWHGSDTECPKCDGTGYVNDEQGVAEEAQNKDMTGQTCEKCKKGKYQERSQYDDMEGKVTCKCGHRVNRWKNYKEQGVGEGNSKAMASTAKSLENPPKIMQHRAKRDMERDQQLKYRDTLRRDEKQEETMLPKSAFAGSDKNKLGPAAHLKGSMKRPARQGDLVGGGAEESIKRDSQKMSTSQKLDRALQRGGFDSAASLQRIKDIEAKYKKPEEPEKKVAEAGFGRNKGYIPGAPSPYAPELGSSRRKDMSDESNLMYRYDSASGVLKQAMVPNPKSKEAYGLGFRDTIEQALRVHNIIRSKFDPKKFVQKQGDKWVSIDPFRKPTPDQDVAEGDKIKGVDGKACWKGKRYAGRVKKADGTYKDKCVPIGEHWEREMSPLIDNILAKFLK